MSVAASIRTAVLAVMVALSAAGAAGAAGAYGLQATVAADASYPAGHVLAAEEMTPSDTPWGPSSATP